MKIRPSHIAMTPHIRYSDWARPPDTRNPFSQPRDADDTLRDGHLPAIERGHGDDAIGLNGPRPKPVTAAAATAADPGDEARGE
ncbi:MAG: hypothetical protein ACO31X_11300, partial [Candidatus Nanopelagicales bacterium]